jgi:hypothetical protein
MGVRASAVLAAAVADVLVDVPGKMMRTPASDTVLEAPNTLVFNHSVATVPGAVATPVNARSAATARAILRSIATKRRPSRLTLEGDRAGDLSSLMQETSVVLVDACVLVVQ